MTYIISWNKKAKKDLRRLYKYLSIRNINAAERKVRQITERIQILTKNPHIAAVEPCLVGFPFVFHSLIVGYHKIIYIVDKEVIKIVCIWDCRQNPNKLIKILNKSR